MTFFRLRTPRRAVPARGAALALRRLAPALALLLAACAQGAGRAPDARPEDPEVRARAERLVEGLFTPETYRAVMTTSLGADRPKLIAQARAAGLTPVQSEALVDLLDEVALAGRGTVVAIYASVLGEVCSPMELDIAVPGDGLGPCVKLRRATFREISDARLHRVFIPEMLSNWIQAVEANRLDYGLTQEQVAELRIAFDREIAAYRAG